MIRLSASDGLHRLSRARRRPAELAASGRGGTPGRCAGRRPRHPEFSRSTGTVALKRTPATLLAIAAQRLAENFGVRPTFLLGKPFRFADYVRRKRERA